MPDVLAKELKDASKNPYVFHYTMHPKPWLNPYDKDAYRFWQMARKVPMYERLIADLCSFCSSPGHTGIVSIPPGGESLPRQISNILLPKGSLRRELAKKLCPKDSALWNFFKRIYYSVVKR